MTREDIDFIGAMNMCDEISNEAYRKIMIHCEEEQPCADAVSRELVKKDIARWIGYIDEDMIARMHITIDKLPSVSTEKTWWWIEQEGYDGDTYYDCSECGESFCLIDGTPTDNLYNYCPNCGCRMVEPQESEEKK